MTYSCLLVEPSTGAVGAKKKNACQRDVFYMKMVSRKFEKKHVVYFMFFFAIEIYDECQMGLVVQLLLYFHCYVTMSLWSMTTFYRHIIQTQLVWCYLGSFSPHIFNHIKPTKYPYVFFKRSTGCREKTREKKSNTLMAKIILSLIRSRTCLSTHNLGLSDFVFPDMPKN